MSATISSAPTISIAQLPAGPSVTITQNPPQPAVPAPYPLAADPDQTWVLQSSGAAVSWVEFVAPPGQRAFALEDAFGGLQLEDGLGYFLMEA